jgi:hypothetical protein
VRFAGAVGFAVSTETAPGVWSDVITERTYYGDVTQNTRRLEPVSMVPPETNQGISLGNTFSIVADALAYENYIHIRYVLWQGNYWEVTSVQVNRPRLILTVGSLWTGNKA